jgi:hypothetical protein
MMKRKTANLVYPTTRTSPYPRIDVLTAYVPEPPQSACAGHPGIAAVWERNRFSPGWHCKFCHALPDAARKGEAE